MLLCKKKGKVSRSWEWQDRKQNVGMHSTREAKTTEHFSESSLSLGCGQDRPGWGKKLTEGLVCISPLLTEGCQSLPLPSSLSVSFSWKHPSSPCDKWTAMPPSSPSPPPPLLCRMSVGFHVVFPHHMQSLPLSASLLFPVRQMDVVHLPSPILPPSVLDPLNKLLLAEP